MRMKRERLRAKLAHNTHRAYHWLIARLVGIPFILAVAACLPFIMVACRLLTPTGKESE